MVTVYHVKGIGHKYNVSLSCWKLIISSSKYILRFSFTLQLHILRRRNPVLKLLILKQGFSACGLGLSDQRYAVGQGAADDVELRKPTLWKQKLRKKRTEEEELGTILDWQSDINLTSCLRQQTWKSSWGRTRLMAGGPLDEQISLWGSQGEE